MTHDYDVGGGEDARLWGREGGGGGRGGRRQLKVQAGNTTLKINRWTRNMNR